MDHDAWIELVSAEADGELDRAESDRLAEHLDGCPSCTALLATFGDARRRSRMQADTPGEHLIDAVLGDREVQVTAASRSRAVLLRRGAVAAASVAAAAVALVVATGGPDPHPAPPVAADPLIAAHDASFDHAHIEVKAGTTVEWENAGSTTHHLVRDLGGATIDEDLSPGQTEAATFEQPGTFRFFCTIHPEMSGVVTVDA